MQNNASPIAPRLACHDVGAAAVLVLAACGGGGGGSSGSGGAPPPRIRAGPRAEAFRFLNRASFGATESTASALIGLGDNTNLVLARWIDAEIAKPASLLNPAVGRRSPELRCRAASASPPRAEQRPRRSVVSENDAARQ